jgi:hypothetical protein
MEGCTPENAKRKFKNGSLGYIKICPVFSRDSNALKVYKGTLNNGGDPKGTPPAPETAMPKGYLTFIKQLLLIPSKFICGDSFLTIGRFHEIRVEGLNVKFVLNL